MDLKTFLKALPTEKAREAFAASCGSTIGHLRNVGYGQRPCAPVLAVAIERESERKVTRQELCPTDWPKVWPELIGTAGAPGVNTAAVPLDIAAQGEKAGV